MNEKYFLKLFKANKQIYFFVFCFIFFFFTACQKEAVEESTNNLETINSATPLTSLIKRVAMVETNRDNFIDHSNYFKVNFPYQITVNNSLMYINSENDYLAVQNNINAHNDDDDEITFNFPINVTLFNYSTRNIQNQVAINNLIDEGIHSTDLFKISGIKVNYPITINSYNTENQILNSTSIQNDLKLYNFLNGISNTQLLSLSYPLSIKDFNNQNMLLNSNLEFENQIKNTLDNFSGNNPVNTDFNQIITTGSWKINYYYRNSDFTNSFDTYTLYFNINHTLTAIKNGLIYYGNWSIMQAGIEQKFTIHFASPLFTNLNENWTVFEFNPNNLHFRNRISGSNQTDYLNFQRVN